MLKRWSQRLVAPGVLMLLALAGGSRADESGRTNEIVEGHARLDQVMTLGQGADLQQAIDRAKPGDTILLSPGATYSGNFLLPNKNGDQFITIRTADAAGQPRADARVHPSHAAALAKIRSPNTQPAIRTAPGAHHWRLQLLEFLPTLNGAGEIIALGDGALRDRAQLPHQLIVDRCYIHGDPEIGQKRGIALNSGATIVRGSYVSDIKVRGQDSQAIGGWNGTGPHTIENNYLEAAGENFMLGGADPAIPGLVTEDVVFRGNHLAKPLAWREQGWTVKNLFELKNARRVLVEDNLMEYSWRDGQVGYAVLLTPRNQDGGAPWATVEDVTLRRNIIRHAGGGINIMGTDDIRPSGPARGIHIVDNVFYDLDAERWGGTGAFLLIGNGPSNITVEHNTVRQSGNIVMVYGGPKDETLQVPQFRFRDNLLRHNLYGVHGTGRAPGGDSLRTFFPDVEFVGNVIAGGEPRGYPSRNTFIADEEFDRQFMDAAGGDFRLRQDSRFRRAGTDGRDVGADVAAIARARGARVGGRGLDPGAPSR
ncbi:hypothetical protein BH24ACI5_BH24ACI5_09070 [soil metagenome]